MARHWLGNGRHEASSGLIGMNTKGQVWSISVDEQTIIPYILTTLNNTEFAFKMQTCRKTCLSQLFRRTRFDEAAEIASNFSRVSLALSSLHARFSAFNEGR